MKQCLSPVNTLSRKAFETYNALRSPFICPLIYDNLQVKLSSETRVMPF